MVPCAYDLIIDGGSVRYRVQVKQAHLIGDSKTRWRCKLTKRDPKNGDSPQAARDVDYLCVVTTPAEVFVIPIQACTSPTDLRWMTARLEIGPESKYRAFINKFAIGDGQSDEIAPVPIYTKPPESLAKMSQYSLGRKRHRRLTLEEVQQIEALPIRWYSAQPKEGTLSVDQVAEQFGVTVATLRNVVLHKKRKDVIRAIAGSAK